MTREEIIEGLKLLEDNMVYFDELLNDKGEYIDVHELLFEAIEALKQEPCEDCISRAEAIEALGYDISIESDEGLDAYKTVIKEMLCKIYDVQKENIENLPSIQPNPKTGHWIYICNSEVNGLKIVKCSSCGRRTYGSGKYCPNCGAKMKSGDKE